MKTKLFIIGLFLFALAACVKVPEPVEGPSPELSAIDSLMWRQPDSALACLLPYFDTCCRDVSRNVSENTNNTILGDVSGNVSTATAYNRHYANLLLSELLYKNDSAQTNRMELLQAMAYFDSLTLLADTRGVFQRPRPRRDARRASIQNIAFLDARTHYINGVGYYENDSVIQACSEYMKALKVMEENFETKGLAGHKAQFIALTYSHLTSLFSDLYLHEQVIYFGKKSLFYYNKYDASPRHLTWILNEIGLHFEMMNNYDSAAFYYHKGLKVLPDTNNLTYRDVATCLVVLSYKTGAHPQISLNQIQKLIEQSETQKEALSRYAIVGEIYYYEKTFDSAWIYLNKVFRESQSVDSKKQVAEWLVEICKVQGKEGEILEYADFLVPFATQEEDKGFIKSRLAELYNTCRQLELEHQHRKKAIKQTRWSIGIVVGLLFVTLGVFILYRKYKIKKQSLEEQIKEEQYAHEIKQKALLGRLRQSNEALRIQKKEAYDLAKKRNIQQKQKEWNHLDDFMNENICHDIVTALRGKQIKREAKSGDYPELHLNDTQLHDLSVAVEKHFCGFEKMLTDLHPKISRNAMNQCLLYLLNLEDAQIASLLSCDYSTVKRRSTKLKQAFGSEKEPRQFIRECVM